MKRILFLPLILCSLTACGGNGEGSLVSTKVVNSVPDYHYGDIFDESTISLNLKYDNGKTKVLNSNDLIFSYGKKFTMFSDKQVVHIASKNDKNISLDYEFEILPRESFSLLMIGNSFSDDTIEYMYQICESLGIECEVVNMYIGGCSIDTHFNNLTYNRNTYEKRVYKNGVWTTSRNEGLSQAISEKDWDFISFQQASGFSGIASSYENFTQLVNLVQEYVVDSDHTQFVFNMTWAYQQNSTHTDFGKYNRNQLEMYDAICDAVQSEVSLNKKIKTIIPNGTAIQNARTSSVGDNLTRDGYHLTFTLGRYIAGLMAVKTLTNANIDEAFFVPSGVNSTQVQIAYESVNNAFENRFTITNSEL